MVEVTLERSIIVDEYKISIEKQLELFSNLGNIKNIEKNFSLFFDSVTPAIKAIIEKWIVENAKT